MTRTPRRTTALLAALGVVGLLALVLPPPVSLAQPAPAAPAALLTVVGQSAWVAPSGTFAVQLRHGALPADAKIVARLYSPISTSAQLAQTALGDGLGAPIQPSVSVAVAQAPQTADTLQLSYPVVATGDLPPYAFRIGPAGVYPFSLGVVGADGQELYRVMTHLIRLPGQSYDRSPLTVALVAPVHAPVAHQPSGELDLGGRATGLADLIAELNRRPAIPISVTPTPETIDALAERDRSTGTSRLVSSLGKAIGPTRQLINGTYVNVDRGAWVGQGLADALTAQSDAGASTLLALLGTTPDRSTTVVDRSTTPEVLAQVFNQGVKQAVVPSDQLVPLARRNGNETLTQTFDLASSNDDRIPAVAADAKLDARLVSGDNPALAAHEVLAELALLSFDQSRYQPCILSGSGTAGCRRGLALQLSANASVAEPALAVFLDAFADRDGTNGTASTSPGKPLVKASTVTDLMGNVDRAAASFSTRSSGPVLVRQLVPVTPPSLGGYPAELESTRRVVDGFRSMTIGTDTLGTAIADSMEQVELSSGAIEFDDAARTSYLDGVRSTVQNQVSSIKAPDRVVITLTSSQARIPLSLSNSLDYPVRVRLRYSSAKLEFPEGTEQTIELPPQVATKILIPVRTRASGSFPFDVTVTSADGALPVAVTRFTVRSTAVSGVGLALTIAAGLFLALWWARHFRNARRGRRLIGSTHPVLRDRDAEPTD